MLSFQRRADGFRVVRVEDGVEHMLASIEAFSAVTGQPAPPMTDDQVQQRITAVGITAALAERDASLRQTANVVEYVRRPTDECTIRSAIGALTVGDLKEMVSYLE